MPEVHEVSHLDPQGWRGLDALDCGCLRGPTSPFDLDAIAITLGAGDEHPPTEVFDFELSQRRWLVFPLRDGSLGAFVKCLGCGTLRAVVRDDFGGLHGRRS